MVMPADHPLDRLSICGFDYSDAPIFHDFELDQGVVFDKKRHTQKKGLPVIENDVWIGHDVFISRGVRIGTGAVIGARSVVTKDVPPYAIVAGSPAVIKRYRFDGKTIERLLESRWWDYAFTDFAGMNTLDPNHFLYQLGDQVATGKIKSLPYRAIDIASEFLRISKSV